MSNYASFRFIDFIIKRIDRSYGKIADFIYKVDELSLKKKKAVNIVQSPFIELGATWGAGAIGTGPGNKVYRQTDKNTGLIKTVLQIDLTGLAVKGDAAHDVIGLAAGGAAYIYRNVVADNGVIFKYEVTCIELPTEGTATITTDIDLTWNSNGARAYDYGLGAETHNLGTLVAGETFTSADDTNLTANDYLYLVEGDTAASTGVYNGGQYVFTFYGYPVR